MKHFLLGTLALAFCAFTAGAAEDIPYYHEFDNPNSLEGFTVESSHIASRTWIYHSTSDQARGASLGMIMTDRDDLLISPALKVEAGKTYDVKYRIAVGNGTETMSVSGGTAPTKVGLTNEIIPQMNVTTNNYFMESSVVLEGRFTATQTGDYYVGLYCNTVGGGTMRVYLYNISVTESAAGLAPATPNNFVVTPDPDGFLKVNIKCNAPAKTVSGENLTSLKAVEFSCDNKVIHTVENPTPGAELSFTHDPAIHGSHSYGVTAISADGRSNMAERAVSVGVGYPNAVTDVIANETETVGQVKISWTAPTTDINGKELKPELLSYKVVSYIDNKREEKQEMVVDGKCELVMNICEPDADQQFRTFGVTAVTSGGESTTEVKSDMIAVGKADELPYEESFANGNPSHALVQVTRMYNTTWGIINNQNQAQDGDNGYIMFTANGVNGQADLVTGKIDLGSEEQPTLSFWMSGYADGNPNTLEVLVNAGNGYEPIGDEYVASTAAWAPVSIDLSKYKGKSIQIIFRGTCRQVPYIALDNIKVRGAYDKDLTIVRSDVPDGIDLMETEPMTFTVGNVGKQTSDPYKVVLYCMDKEIASQDGPALEPGKEYDFEFMVKADKNSYDTQKYRAVIVWDADENQGNNSTPTFMVTIYKPTMENVQNVKITHDENGLNVLTWDTPEGASFGSENPYRNLTGYEIFRNGKKAHEGLLKENTFTDTTEPTKDTAYTFITHYEAGSSKESNEYKYSGIESVVNGAAYGVEVANGAINIAGDAQVYDLNGVLIADVKGKAVVDVLPGIYMVRVDGKTIKVMVK